MRPPASAPQTLGGKIIVYESLLAFVEGALDTWSVSTHLGTQFAHLEPPSRNPHQVAQLRLDLKECLSLALYDAVTAIAQSLQVRKVLLEIVSKLSLTNDSNLRAALRTDSERIATLLVTSFRSESEREAILNLSSDLAQCFLDVVQEILGKRLLQDAEHRIARSIVRRLSEASDSLPSSLFIPNAVCTREIYPTFGGGFGDIYRATVGGKPVALKRMRQFLQGSDLRRIHLKFCREALIWKDLKHPHILPLIGIDRDSFPDFMCMVSPWMEHGTVIDYLKKYGHDIVDKLLYEIAQGLQYLHSRNIIHGDLKGANILIQENWTACLADFGLSEFSDASTSMSSNRGGSVYWMAPELLDPHITFARTPAIDIYAFGCVCLELYTGRPPFAKELDIVAATKIIAGERPLRPSSSPAMSDLLWEHVTSYWGQNSTCRPTSRQVVENMRHQEERECASTQRTSTTAITPRNGSLPDLSRGAATQTREEKLLAELLASNELLVDALKLYDDLKRVARERCVAVDKLLSRIDKMTQATLDGHLASMRCDNVISGVVASPEHRKVLLEFASKLHLENDSRLREALHADDEGLAAFIVSILVSKSARQTVLALEEDYAQDFLDVVQETLNRGFLMAPDHSRYARRIVRKLSETCDKLPSSLFLTGITHRDAHPTYIGGFGDIYRATHENKNVALKHMRHFVQSSIPEIRDIRAKFCREALIWQDLHHPHILPFLGIDRNSFPSSLCAVSPWMQHGTILKYLKDHGRGNVDRLLYEIAQGLEYLHSRGIIHGDLKGANILIQENWTACLADFGLSGFPDASTSMSSDRGGSVYWMAPELLDPLRDRYIFAQTPATDIYAFGCVCFELYTGRPPFADVLDVVAATKIIAGERPVRPSSSPAMSDLLWQHVTSYWGQSSTSRPETRQVVENMRRHTSLALPIPFSSQN
ncbi:kinase-like protein [Favolaschia claudopus]|uniref:Kinase-like protein n=1 Tax=Favolaschia claudopus TaxID=2862362 RepID=A0AAW0DQY1_9AGAR